MNETENPMAEIKACCTHELKCWPEYFEAVQSGDKPFEVRKWDRPYAVGDTLLLREYDPEAQDYTGRELTRTISYLLDLTYLPGDNTPHFAGYVVLGLIRPAPENRWIPVSERLPEVDGAYFIWHISKDFGGMCVSTHWNSIKKTFGQEEMFGGKTTHWMPLPEAPKEDV